ncbi:MAG: saccharopine dehydrogenase family protein [Promethearchaeota archaeon]
MLVLGGAGDMGRMAVTVLLESPSVNSTTVADINLNHAKVFAEMVNSDKLSPVQIDINESDKLTELIKSHDIVINTVGPFYKFAVPIMEAVIKAKKPYLDINDDWKPTLDVLKMDSKAKDAGITALIGIGASPGISNLLAVLACSKLDKVEDLVTAWGESISMKEGKKPKYYVDRRDFRKRLGESQRRSNAAMDHWIYEALENIPTFKDGQLIEINSLTETESFDFPGYKPMYACHIGHPEPVTLSRTIKANNISNVMYVGETLTGYLRGYRDRILKKELTIEEASLQLQEDMRKAIKEMKMGRSPLKEYLGGPPTLCCIALGVKDGKKKKVAVALGRNPYDEMAGVTGVPLAIATLMLIEGRITKKGILTPEEALDPLEFFDRIAPYCGKNLTGKDILIQKEIDL